MVKENGLAKDLEQLLGDRVTVSEFERWFYTSDIMHIPRGIRAMFKTMPDAVVRPSTAEQVMAVVRYCQQHGLPIVPRGAGSSGLFGAVPKKGGIVFDLLDLSRIEDIDSDKETVTAGAGSNWWQVEKALKREDLGLMSYPSSARSATLAGWVMTSGFGIGTLKYGPVFNQLVSADVVLPDGNLQQFIAGEGLERFYESEGMLGIITRLTIKVGKIPKTSRHHLIYFDDIGNLFRSLSLLVSTSPQPYNIEFQDSRYLSLLRDGGYEVPEFTRNSGVLLVSYEGNERDVKKGSEILAGFCSDYHGEVLEGADREWQQRFNILRIKRAVPSIVPSNVSLPIGRVADFYSAMHKWDKRIGGLLGYVVSADNCSLMPMIVTDTGHPLEYLFALQTPSAISDLAISLGGKPGGGTGVWNAAYREQILGKTKFRNMKSDKAQLDPRKIMNPGMWLEPPLLFRPAFYRLATGIGSRLGMILPASTGQPTRTGFDKELADCVQCGHCMSVCPTNRGWLSSTPRGRILITREHFLKGHGAEKFAPEYIERIFQCTLCGRCGVDCSVDIKSRLMWQGLRANLRKRDLQLESLDNLITTISETHNLANRPNDQRANWANRLKLPYNLNEKRTTEVVYFVGCVTSFFPMAQPAARALAQIMENAGIDFGIVGGEEWCCGFPLMAAGASAAAAECVSHNIERVTAMGAKIVVMNCPGCYRVWKDEYREIVEQRHDFEILHGVELMARLIEAGKIDIKGLENKVTYHDPCDLGRNSGIFDEPRYILDKISGLELVELADNRQYCACCGSGGDLLASNQDMTMDIARRKVDEVLATGTDTVVTACPSCVRTINMARTAARVKLDVVDIGEILWKAMEN